MKSSVVGTEFHNYSVSLSIGFSSYKSVLSFEDLEYDIPSGNLMNLTLLPTNVSPTSLRISLVSYAANRFEKVKVRYMVYNSALTEI